MRASHPRIALNIIYIMRNDVSGCGGVRVLGVEMVSVFLVLVLLLR